MLTQDADPDQTHFLLGGNNSQILASDLIVSPGYFTQHCDMINVDYYLEYLGVTTRHIRSYVAVGQTAVEGASLWWLE